MMKQENGGTQVGKGVNAMIFLKGGGEMGDLTRDFDWSKTTLGLPDVWPYSLRVSVSNMLQSNLPTLILWGKDYKCFYNDAVIPSLDPNKHPALGKPAREIWTEGWGFIAPLLENVMNTGEPVTFRNQPVFTQRNGKTEDVYWTFCYSLILDDQGDAGGILVTCEETTETLRWQLHLEESNTRFREMIEQAPVAIGLTVGDDLVFESINPPMLRLIHRKSKTEVLGKKLLEVLPELREQPVYEILLDVLRTGETFQGTEIPTELMVGNSLQNRYYNVTYSRILESSGMPAILHM